MTKSELKSLVRELLHEELCRMSLTEAVAVAPAEELLATHIVADPEFESACLSGNAFKILEIVDRTMEDKDMYTPGAKKLRNDIARMTKGYPKVPSKIGEQILFFVWNSQLSGTGHKVI
jgi:hypothetical protein